MSQSAQERINAKKQRVQDLQKARENLRSQRDSEEVFESISRSCSVSSSSGTNVDGNLKADLLSELDSVRQQLAVAEEERNAARQHVVHLEDQHKADIAVISQIQDELSEVYKKNEIQSKQLAEALESSSPSSPSRKQEVEHAAQAIWDQNEWQFKQQISKLNVQIAEEQSRYRELLDEYEAKQQQWRAVARLIIGDSDNLDGPLDLNAVAEERFVLTQEVNEMGLLVQDCMAQITDLRSERDHFRKNAELYEDTISAYEEETRQMKATIQALNQQLTSVSHSSDEEISQGLRLDSMEMDYLKDYDALFKEYKRVQIELNRTKNQNETLELVKDNMQDEMAQLIEEVKKAHDTVGELEAELEKAYVEANTNQEQMEEILREEHEALVNMHRKVEDAAKLVIIKEEEISTQKDQFEHQLEQSNQELVVIKKEAQDVQVELDLALRQAKNELAESLDTTKSAALAGMSLADAIDALKQDHNDVLQNLKRVQAENIELRGSLAEKTEMLEQVAKHLKLQGEDGDESSEGGNLDANVLEDMNALIEQLDQFTQERANLLELLAEAEAQNEKLRKDSDALLKQCEELEQRNTELSTELSDQQNDLIATLNKASELEKLVSQFKDVLGGGDGLEDSTGSNEGSNSITADDLNLLEAALNEYALEHDRLTALCEEQQKQIELLKEQGDNQQAIQDHLDELQQAASEKQVFKTKLDQAQHKLQSLNSENQKLKNRISELESELETVKNELKEKSSALDAALKELEETKSAFAAASADLRKAAEAGLSLTDMLDQLKAEHAAEVEKLEQENFNLLEKLNLYERAIQELLEQAGLEGSDENLEQLLEDLKTKLATALDTQSQLYELLGCTEEELNERLKELEELKQNNSELNSENEDLKTQLAELEKALEQAMEELANTREALVKAAESFLAREGLQGSASFREGLDGTEDFEQLLEHLAARLAEVRALQDENELSSQRQAELLAQLNLLKDEKSDLADELASSKRQHSAANMKCSRLEHQLKIAKHKAEQAEDRYQQMQNMAQRNIDTITMQQNLIRQLKQTLDSIRSLGGKDGNFTQSEAIDKIKQLELKLLKSSDINKKLQDYIDKQQELFRNRFLRKWNDDTESCEECDLMFDTFHRRHHCRMCGRVMCSDCCNRRLEIAAQKRPARVCQDCFEFVGNILTGKKPIESDLPDESEIKMVHLLKSDQFPRFGLKLDLTKDAKTQKIISVDVVGICKGSSADLEGVLIRDEILAIDGHIVGGSTEAAVSKALSKSEATLTLRCHWLSRQNSLAAAENGERFTLLSEVSPAPSEPSTPRQASPTSEMDSDFDMIDDAVPPARDAEKLATKPTPLSKIRSFLFRKKYKQKSDESITSGTSEPVSPQPSRASVDASDLTPKASRDNTDTSDDLPRRFSDIRDRTSVSSLVDDNAVGIHHQGDSPQFERRHESLFDSENEDEDENTSSDEVVSIPVLNLDDSSSQS